MRLSEVKAKTSTEVVRDGEFESLGLITGSKPKQLGFIEDAKYLPELLSKTNITCVISTPSLVSSVPERLGVGVSNNPRKTFYEIHNYLAKETHFYGKSFNTEIAPSAKIHPTAYIAERNVRIGDECEIGPNACILENSILEDRVVVRAGAVIGTEGFQFSRIGDKVVPTVHAGGVILHNGVEIQGNTVVDKAVFDEFTELGENTKVDNLVHIAHNVHVGKNCLIAALAAIAGSVTIGNDVWIGPCASIIPEIKIGNGAFISIGAVVTKDVAPGQRVTGNFAIDHDKFITFIRKIR